MSTRNSSLPPRASGQQPNNRKQPVKGAPKKKEETAKRGFLAD